MCRVVECDLVELLTEAAWRGRVEELKELYGPDSPYYKMYADETWDEVDETSKKAYRQESRWIIEAIPDGLMKIAGQWHKMECFTQYRQKQERGRIEVAQNGDCWMDGRYLWREMPES